MDKADIRELMREVAGPGAQFQDHGEWVSTHCPFARWTHVRGTDRNMSFGIKENLHGPSIFNCFTCKNKGTLPQMLERLGDLDGEDYSGLLGGVEEEEFMNARLPEWDQRRSHNSKAAKLGEPVAADYLDIYDEAAGHPYLVERRIDDDSANMLDLRVDPDDHGHERILFPVYSPDGGFYGYTGRAVVRGIEPRIRDYFGLPKRLLLLGAEWVHPDSDDLVVLVEGLFDFARIFSLGIPCVASMHSGLTPAQAQILKDFALPVVVMYDNDQAGEEGRSHIRQQLGDHLRLRKVRYPTRATVRDARTRRMRAPKDPGELTGAQVEWMLDNARLL